MKRNSRDPPINRWPKLKGDFEMVNVCKGHNVQ